MSDEQLRDYDTILSFQMLFGWWNIFPTELKYWARAGGFTRQNPGLLPQGEGDTFSVSWKCRGRIWPCYPLVRRTKSTNILGLSRSSVKVIMFKHVCWKKTANFSLHCRWQ
jgi:hypothetical protein